MARFFTDDEKHHRRMAGATTVMLLACTAALVLVPHSAEWLTGIRSAPKLASPDDLPALSSADGAPFLRERDQMEIRVAESTTLRQFLDRNRLNRPYTRKQITDQFGNADPNAQIAAGTVFRLRLTPVAEDVPGATPEPPR